MNILANEFNFYAVDKPDQQNVTSQPINMSQSPEANKKKWRLFK